MRKSLIALLAILMAFSFVACDSNTAEPAGPKTVKVTTLEELGEALADETAEVIVVTADIGLDRQGVAIERKVTLKGEGDGKITIKNTDLNNSNWWIELKTDGIVIDNLDISTESQAVSTYLINVAAENITIKNSKIEGIGVVAPSSYTPGMGINVGPNASGAIIEGCTLVDCYTPIFSSTASITVKDNKWNSGAVFEKYTDGETIITGNSSYEDGVITTGKIDFKDLNPVLTDEQKAAIKTANNDMEIRETSDN